MYYRNLFLSAAVTVASVTATFATNDEVDPIGEVLALARSGDHVAAAAAGDSIINAAAIEHSIVPALTIALLSKDFEGNQAEAVSLMQRYLEPVRGSSTYKRVARIVKLADIYFPRVKSERVKFVEIFDEAVSGFLKNSNEVLELATAMNPESKYRYFLIRKITETDHELNGYGYLMLLELLLLNEVDSILKHFNKFYSHAINLPEGEHLFDCEKYVYEDIMDSEKYDAINRLAKVMQEGFWHLPAEHKKFETLFAIMLAEKKAYLES